MALTSSTISSFSIFFSKKFFRCANEWQEKTYLLKVSRNVSLYLRIYDVPVIPGISHNLQPPLSRIRIARATLTKDRFRNNELIFVPPLPPCRRNLLVGSTEEWFCTGVPSDS